MSKFTAPLDVRVLDNGDRFEVLKDFTYYLENNTHIVLKVPAGFITDFASVPKIFWGIIGPIGKKYTKSTVLHDMLCEANHKKLEWKDVVYDENVLTDQFKNQCITRKDADDIFLESMLAVKVNKITAYTMYFFVRLYAKFKGLK